MRILFFDPCTPRPYDLNTLQTEAMGGTEATIVRLAEAMDAQVEQHNRITTSGRYLPAGSVKDADHVVCVRGAGSLNPLKARFPNAKFYLLLEDLPTRDLTDNIEGIRAVKPIIVPVSDWHLNVVKDYLGQWEHGCRIKRVYNPVDDDLRPDQTPVDPTKLVFFSSPHKGLAHTLKMFACLKGYTLYIANPGYIEDYDVTKESKVVNLGPLSHRDIVNHVRTALCVFYMNYVFPETFGIVFAEANAVGTPVLTSNIGAAKEILWHPTETIDVQNVRAVMERLQSWQQGNRPKVKVRPEFRLKVVVEAWRRLFNGY